MVTLRSRAIVTCSHCRDSPTKAWRVSFQSRARQVEAKRPVGSRCKTSEQLRTVPSNCLGKDVVAVSGDPPSRRAAASPRTRPSMVSSVRRTSATRIGRQRGRREREQGARREASGEHAGQPCVHWSSAGQPPTGRSLGKTATTGLTEIGKATALEALPSRAVRPRSVACG